MKISSFIALKELTQNTDKIMSYAENQYISPINGIDIYIRAIDKISTGVSDIIELTTKITKLIDSPHSKDNYDVVEFKKSLAEHYLKIRGIVDEFTRGFSLTHDQNITETISLLYRGFENISNLLDLGYMTGKPTYYEEVLGRLTQTRLLFLQMLEVLQKSLVSQTPDSLGQHDLDISVSKEC